jgi:hypothetical protein
MSITLAASGTTITLSPDLFWPDENDWTPVQQSVETTITGAMDVQVGTRLNGRPITLQPENDTSGWMPYSVVEQLRNWAAVPGLELVLTLRSTPRTVMFRHQDGGFEATPVAHRRDVLSTDPYRCVIRFMEV